MRLLVVGGSGFLGPPLVAGLLRRGHDVAVLHRGSDPAAGGGGSSLPPEVAQIRADRNALPAAAGDIRRFAPDVAVDLVLSSAAQARELMDVLRGVAARVVAASSLDVYRATGVLYGSEPGGLEPVPLTESSPLRSRLRVYPTAQIRALQRVFSWLDDDYDKIPVERVVLGDPDLPGTVLRLPILYGPRDKLRRLRPIVQRVADRRPLVLGAAMAGWRAARSFVGDAAEAIAIAATDTRAAGRVYNVAEPEAASELEWARRVAAAAGWDGEVVVIPDELTPEHLRAPGDTRQHWTADSARLRHELGWSERTSRDEALRRAVEWERGQPAAPASERRAHYAAEDAALAARAAGGRP